VQSYLPDALNNWWIKAEFYYACACFYDRRASMPDVTAGDRAALLWRRAMVNNIATKTGRGLALATALVAAAAFTAPTPAEARIGTGAAIGLGLGAFALGAAVGSAPYYGGYYGGYGGYGGYGYSGYGGYPYGYGHRSYYYPPAYPYYSTSTYYPYW
jgi:hypothetical protein